MENKIATVLTIILLLAIAAGGLYYSYNLQTNPGASPTPSATNTPIKTISPNPTSEAPDNWVTYASEQFGFSIIHPPNMEISEDPQEGVRFTKLGPTQKQGTEFYDGISLTFSSGSYSEDNLETFVEAEHAKMQEEAVTQNLSNIEKVTINGTEGYQFKSVSLGTFTHIYLPAGEKRYVHIVNATLDPEDEGFEKTVNTMLSTLEISS